MLQSESPPVKIEPTEELVRCMFYERDARRAQRGNVPLSIFLEKIGEPKLSTDRKCWASLETLAGLCHCRERNREGGQFQGWALIFASDASQNGRHVESSRTECNPYHADIVLPDNDVGNKVLQKQHAVELAESAVWLESPESN